MMKKKLTCEVVLYLVFGAMTTLINILTYSVLYYRLNVSNTIANVISWLFSVMFAYTTNRKWVFESKNKNIFVEMSEFFGCRIMTGILDLGIMYVFVDLLRLEGGIIKIVANIIVIILNYVLSKVIIFKKER